VSASESLSQLLARILDQLALSAWLPAAAMALLVAFVLRLGSVLDATSPHPDPSNAIGISVESLGKVGLGGAVLLLATVIVLTMLTQAFSFEAIRVLEGYWGSSRISEGLAEKRSRRHRNRRTRLENRLKDATANAWASAEQEINATQQELLSRNRDVVFSPAMIDALKARALGLRATGTLPPDARRRVRDTDWKVHADPELIRRRVSLMKQLRDYPVRSILPTRLGNVLRHHEDQTGRVEVEGMVSELYDNLPFSLRLTHDEQRSRLDVYCSMVFVLLTVAVLAVARFGQEHWHYGLAALVVGAFGAWFAYRAAVASARAYGATLLSISLHGQPGPAS
jgi:hypothetical protein